MTEAEFWMAVRRAAIAVAHAVKKRYNFTGLLVLLTGQAE